MRDKLRMLADRVAHFLGVRAGHREPAARAGIWLHFRSDADDAFRCARWCLSAWLLALHSLSALAQTWQIPKPSPGLMPNPSAGKALYDKHCTACHGAGLKGTDKGPPFLHRVYEPSHHADVAFQLAARNGVRAHHWQFGDMPPVPQVTPDDVAHITAYIRSEQRKAGIR